MKFYETHFEEYINENNRLNLHPKLDKLYEKFPLHLQSLKNLVFFGDSHTARSGFFSLFTKTKNQFYHPKLIFQ